MTHCAYTNLTLNIQGDRAPYLVQLEYQGLTAGTTFEQNVHSDPWTDYLTRLESPIRPTGEAEIAEIGAHLYQGIIQGQVRDLWLRARGDLESGRTEYLRLRLAIRPPEVAVLPWESLYDPDRRTFFGTNHHTALVRIENDYRLIGSVRPLRTSLPLRVLLAMPDDPAGQMSSAQEMAGIRAIVSQVGESQVQLYTLTGRFTIEDLRRKMIAVQPHVLHLATHGFSDGILLWQGDRPDRVSPARLRTILEPVESVRLVFLNACLAGQGSRRIPLAAVGPQLLQTGIPAVVAMQFVIRDEAAVHFAAAMYESLIRGRCAGAIDTAVTRARSTLFALNSGRFDFGTPVLWLNSPDGVIFHLPPQGDVTAEAAPSQRATVPARSPGRVPAGPRAASAPSHPVVDVAELRQWLASLADIDPDSVPVDLGFVVHQRRQDIQDLQALLNQYERLAPIPARDGLSPELLDNVVARLYDKQNDILRLNEFIQEWID